MARPQQHVAYVNSTTDTNLKFILVDFETDADDDGGVLQTEVVNKGDVATPSVFEGKRYGIVYDVVGGTGFQPLGKPVDTGSTQRRVTVTGSAGVYSIGIGAY